MKGVPIDESLCAYLKEYRRGQENAASSKELEREGKRGLPARVMTRILSPYNQLFFFC